MIEATALVRIADSGSAKLRLANRTQAYVMSLARTINHTQTLDCPLLYLGCLIVHLRYCLQVLHLDILVAVVRNGFATEQEEARDTTQCHRTILITKAVEAQYTSARSTRPPPPYGLS